MKAFSKTLLLLAGMSLLLAGCQKEGRFDSDSSLIRFSAATRPETKTVYSGQDFTENGVTYERIDWIGGNEGGDEIRIWSPDAADRYHDTKHYADYRVVEVTPDGRRSKAKIVNSATEYPVDPGVPDPYTDANDNVNGLVWGDAGNYTFYGIYPIVENGALSNGGGFSFTGTIPSTQELSAHEYSADKVAYEPDMKSAYMAAAVQVETSTAGKGPAKGVTLEFDPLFTAFEISLSSESEAAVELKTFELIANADAPALTGNFTVTYSGLTRTISCTGTGKKVSCDLSGLTVSSTKSLVFTFLALPQDLTGLAVNFIFANGETRKLDLTYASAVTVGGVDYPAGSYVPFAAFKKHRIKGIAMPDWRIYYQPDFLDVDKWVELGTTNLIVE